MPGEESGRTFSVSHDLAFQLKSLLAVSSPLSTKHAQRVRRIAVLPFVNIEPLRGESRFQHLLDRIRPEWERFTPAFGSFAEA